MKKRTKRWNVAASFFLLVLGFGILFPPVARAAEDSSDVSYSLTYGQSSARQMLDSINTWRTGDTWYWNEANTEKIAVSGRGELTYDAALEKVAMKRAAELALYFSHTRPDGSSSFTAYGSEFNVGYRGENIAVGYATAASVFEGWKEEDDSYEGQGHRRNMLSDNFQYIGIGHVYCNGQHYWTQEFASAAGGEELGSANDSQEVYTTALKNSLVARLALSLGSFESEVKLEKDKKKELPAVTAYLETNDGWHTRYPVELLNVPSVWTSSNTSVVSIEGNQIKAVASGTAAVKVEVSMAGKTESLSFTVTVPEDATKQSGSTATPGASSATKSSGSQTSGSASTSVSGSGTAKSSQSASAPKGTSLTKVTGKKKSLYVKWKKQKKQITGYQLQYSVNKNMKSSKKKTVSKTKTTYTLKKLKSKKKYYVRIRTYRTKSGKKYYSSWSKIKSAKVK